MTKKLNGLKDSSSVARMKRSEIRGRAIAAIPVLRFGFIRATHFVDEDRLLLSSRVQSFILLKI